MLPTVVVDVVPSDATAELTERMVDACSRALAAGKCALSASVPESTRTESVAMILWQGPDWLRVNVRVGGRERKWVVRQLSFSNEDPLLDRWATVGLTIATLVDEIEPRPSATEPVIVPAPPATAPSEAPSPLPPAPKSFELPRWFLSSSGVAGTGWRRGGPRLGIAAAVGLRIADTPFIGTLGLGYAASRGPELELGNAHTNWYALGLGLAARGLISRANLAWQGGLELALQRAVASAGSEQGADDEWLPRLRALAAWPGRGPLAASLAGTVELPLASADEDAELRKPTLSFIVALGLEARW